MALSPRDHIGTGPYGLVLSGVAGVTARDCLVVLLVQLGGRLQGIAVLHGAILGHTFVLLLILFVIQDRSALQVLAAAASPLWFLLVHADDAERDGGLFSVKRWLRLCKSFI